jgi:lysozyme family protein
MSLLADNTRRWEVAKYKPSQMPRAKEFARRALKYKERYQELVARIHREYGYRIPWWVVPLIHERECLRGVDNWTCSIGQGWPFHQKSKNKPYTGPFASWEDAAVDSLVKQHPYAARWGNWSGGGAMTKLEEYNGLGYARKGRPSPYIWAQSDQYVKGKYVADGKYDPNFVDPQLGVAISLKAMMALDPSIRLDNNIEGQDTTPRKAEATVSMSLPASVLAYINAMSPYYTFTWLDITGFILGSVVIAGVSIYLINRWKRSQIQ